MNCKRIWISTVWNASLLQIFATALPPGGDGLNCDSYTCQTLFSRDRNLWNASASQHNANTKRKPRTIVPVEETDQYTATKSAISLLGEQTSEPDDLDDFYFTDLEKQYVRHFGDSNEGESFRSRYWKPAMLLNFHDRKALEKICAAAYAKLHPSTTHAPKIRDASFSMRELILGFAPAKTLFIDVLTCRTKTSEVFYMTKGSRDNSVYFVLPTGTDWGRPSNFILDGNFRSDVDLPYSFTKSADSVLAKLRQASRFGREVLDIVKAPEYKFFHLDAQ